MNKILIVFIIAFSVSCALTSAISENITGLVGLSSLETQTLAQGGNFSILGGIDLDLTGIVKMPGDTSTRCYLLGSSKAVLASSTSFTGNTCNLAYTLRANNTYIVAFNATSGSYDSNRSSTGNTPVNGTYLNWTFGFGDGNQYPQTRSVAGLVFTLSTTNLAVNLSFPTNNFQLITVGANFTASYIVTGLNLTNATYYIWNSNGSIFNRTTVPVTGNVSNSTLQFIDDFVFGNNYIWNVFGCGVNSTSTVCRFAPSNFTFQSVPFTATGVGYNNITYETSRESYNITITADNFISAGAVLNYNGTVQQSTVSCTSISCTFMNTLDVPLINSINQNKTFFWNISIFSGTSVTYYTSDVYTQTVKELNLSSCSSGTRALNFTAYDEQNQTRINPYAFDGSFNYYLGTGDIYKSTNISLSSIAEVNLCINVNTTYYIDSIIAYSAPNSSIPYTTRNWFYQNYPISNETLSVPLYLLRTSASTSFVLSVQDQSRLPLRGVLIEAQRCYPGSAPNNSVQTVFKSRTDSNGLSTGNFEAETALYQFLITNNSQTLLAVTPCSKVVPQTVPYTLNFILSQSYVSPFNDIDTVNDITSVLYYNYTSNVLTWTYIDTSGNFTNAQLIVRNINYTGRGTNVVCSQNNSLSSGVITCNVSQPGSYYAQANVYRTDQILIDQITFIVNTLATSLGYYSVFLCFFLLLICGFAFKYNEIAGIALLNVGVIAINYMGWVAFGNVFITSMVCVSLLIAAVLQR